MSSQYSPFSTPTKDQVVSRSSSVTDSPHRSDIPIVQSQSRSRIRFNNNSGYSKLDNEGIAVATTNESVFEMPQYPIEEKELRKKEIEHRCRCEFLFHITCCYC